MGIRSVSCNETQISQAECSEICKSNYPIAKGYWKLVSPKFQKHSALKLAEQTIPCAKHSGISRESEDMIPPDLMLDHIRD